MFAAPLSLNNSNEKHKNRLTFYTFHYHFIFRYINAIIASKCGNIARISLPVCLSVLHTYIRIAVPVLLQNYSYKYTLLSKTIRSVRIFTCDRGEKNQFRRLLFCPTAVYGLLIVATFVGHNCCI